MEKSDVINLLDAYNVLETAWQELNAEGDHMAPIRLFVYKAQNHVKKQLNEAMRDVAAQEPIGYGYLGRETENTCQHGFDAATCDACVMRR